MSDADETLALAVARGSLTMFTPKRPMIVGEEFYRDVVADGRFADLLDRMRVIDSLPQ